MPCSLCGLPGHNSRTCQQKKKNEDEKNIIMTMIIIEEELRYLIMTNQLNKLTDDKIKFYESFLNLNYKKINLINLNHDKKLLIYMINGNSNILENIKDKQFMGYLEPRSLISIETFTGYKYLIYDEYSNFPDEILINKDTADTLIINNMFDNDIKFNKPNSKILNSEDQKLISLLKLNYLIQQLIRLGAMNDENYACILDLHKDIKIPDHDDLDLEASGLPNGLFTNN